MLLEIKGIEDCAQIRSRLRHQLLMLEMSEAGTKDPLLRVTRNETVDRVKASITELGRMIGDGAPRRSRARPTERSPAKEAAEYRITALTADGIFCTRHRGETTLTDEIMAMRLEGFTQIEIADAEGRSVAVPA